jgi:hypothetical protein
LWIFEKPFKITGKTDRHNSRRKSQNNTHFAALELLLRISSIQILETKEKNGEKKKNTRPFHKINSILFLTTPTRKRKKKNDS